MTSVRECRGLQLRTYPDGRVIAVRAGVMVGFTWHNGVEWRARRMDEEFDFRVASQHAGAAFVVRGCPDCSCEAGCDGLGCVGCSYCLRGCSEGVG